MKYFQKKIEVDARQFTGEPENGKAIAKWVNDSSDCQAEYWPENKAALLKLGASIHIVEANDRVEWTAFPGEWVVKIEDEVHVYGDEEFKQRFEKGE